MGFNIRSAPGNVTILDLDGELDRHMGLRELRNVIAKLRLSKDTRLVLNFRTVTYICSEAVGAVCSLAEEIRKAGGRAACCAVQGLPRSVFEILGVSKILASHETEAEAVKSVLSETTTTGRFKSA